MRKIRAKILSILVSGLLILGPVISFNAPEAGAITSAQLASAFSTLQKVRNLTQAQVQETLAIASNVVNNVGIPAWLSTDEINRLKAKGLTGADVNEAIDAVRTAVNNGATWSNLTSADQATQLAAVADLANEVINCFSADFINSLRSRGIETDEVVLAALDLVNVQISSWANLPVVALNTIFDNFPANPAVSRDTAARYGLNWDNVNQILGSLSDTDKNKLKDILVKLGNWSTPITNPTVNVDENNKNLEITAETIALGQEVTVNIPAAVENATISVATLLNNPVGGTVTTDPLPPIEIAAVTSLSAAPVKVEIPAGTTVSAPAGANWTGTIQAPTVVANNTVSVSGTVNAVIEVGFGDVPLTFSKAVRILIPGQAGKSAGYVRNSVFTPITATLSADSQAVADAEIPAGGEAKIDAGQDMAIWTKHFTKFVSYVPADGGGGGGGGGGAVAVPGLVSDAVLANAVSNAANTGKVSLKAAATDTQLALSAAQISLVEATGKPLEITISGVTMLLNAAALKAPGLNMSNVGSVALGAKKLSDGPAGTVAGKALNKNLYSIIGDIFQLSATANMSDGTQQAVNKFNGAVKVTLPAPAAAGKAAAEGKLTAGRFNETTGSWDEVAGKYDAAAGAFQLETDLFSYWALMSRKEIKEAPGKTFSDIAGHWAKADIEFMASGGYIAGMGGGKFAPDAPVTRAQFAAMLANVLKLAGSQGTVPFKDVQAGAWYHNAVGLAYNAGLIKGMGDGRFDPEAAISREQMAVMICNALRYKGVAVEVVSVDATLAGFSDRAAISGWARTAAAQAVKTGVLKGRPAGTAMLFAPRDNATRAEAAVMLRNMLDQLT